MFKKFFDFGIKRSLKQAVGFFLFYFVLFFLISTLVGGIYGAMFLPNVANINDGIRAAMADSRFMILILVFSQLMSISLSILVLLRKGLLWVSPYVLLIPVVAILTYYCGVLAALIAIAFVTTRPTIPPRV